MGVRTRCEVIGAYALRSRCRVTPESLQKPGSDATLHLLWGDHYRSLLTCPLSCACFVGLRSAVYCVVGEPGRANRDAMYRLLRIVPSDDGFAEMVTLAAAIDNAAGEFWRRV